MRTALLTFVTMSLGLAAQTLTTQALKSDLLSLRAAAPDTRPLKRQVGMDILSLAEKTHEPALSTLQAFTDSLVDALAGQALSAEDVDQLAGEIERTLQSAGTSTIGFQETVRDFEKQLIRVGVKSPRSHMVATSLERLGKEVRGPEGFPAR
jgi:hypothetical protein